MFKLLVFVIFISFEIVSGDQYKTFEMEDCFTASLGENGETDAAAAGLEKKVIQRAVAQAGIYFRKAASQTDRKFSINYGNGKIIEEHGNIKIEQKNDTEKQQPLYKAVKYCAAYTVSIDTGAISAYYRKLEAEMEDTEMRFAKEAAELKIAESAAQEQEETPQIKQDKSTSEIYIPINKTINGIECVLVKAGSFITIHGAKITLTDDFYIGKYEITQAQYEAVMKNNPAEFKGNNRPVENVSWNDAAEFCRNLGGSLPTEAQWEFAARGGNNSKSYNYSGSNNLDEIAWFVGNSGKETKNAGEKQPNELGIYDMSGNVWEWTNDLYGNYGTVSATNPVGTGANAARVMRGGSFGSVKNVCTVSNRRYDPPDYKYNGLGFRIVFLSERE